MIQSQIYDPYMVHIWSISGPLMVNILSISGPYLVHIWSISGQYLVILILGCLDFWDGSMPMEE